jgi:hypothetical protein
LRDEVASLKRDMEALQLQNRNLSCGVARVIELTRAELLHTRQAPGAAQDATANLRTVTYGGQDYPGNFHYTMFSRESLRTILREARFNPGEYSCVARPNGLCLEMEITATRLP